MTVAGVRAAAAMGEGVREAAAVEEGMAAVALEVEVRAAARVARRAVGERVAATKEVVTEEGRMVAVVAVEAVSEVCGDQESTVAMTVATAVKVVE